MTRPLAQALTGWVVAVMICLPMNWALFVWGAGGSGAVVTLVTVVSAAVGVTYARVRIDRGRRS